MRILGLVALLTLLPAVTFADATDPFREPRAECEQRVKSLDQEIHFATMWRGILTVVSAAIAAAGSAVAAFAKKTTARRVAGIAGAIGAVVATVPTLIPNSDELAKVKKLSEQHRLMADKVRVQIPLLSDAAYANSCTRYVLSRYTSCASPEPEEEIQGLPRHTSDSVEAHSTTDALLTSKFEREVPASKRIGKTPASNHTAESLVPKPPKRKTSDEKQYYDLEDVLMSDKIDEGKGKDMANKR